MTEVAPKLVTDRTRSFRHVKSTFAESIEVIVGFFLALYGEMAGTHVRGLFAPVMAALDTRHAAMVAAAAALGNERSESVAATAERDRRARACLDLLVPLRGTLESLYGADYARNAGFGGPLPSSPEAILTLATNVRERIATLAAPRNVLTDAIIEPTSLVQRLAEPTEELRVALATASDENKQTVTAKSAKDEAIEEFDRSFKVAATLLSTLLEFAGKPDLARRVRPSARRPGNTEEVAETDDASAAAATPEVQTPAAATTG